MDLQTSSICSCYKFGFYFLLQYAYFIILFLLFPSSHIIFIPTRMWSTLLFCSRIYSFINSFILLSSQPAILNTNHCAKSRSYKNENKKNEILVLTAVSSPWRKTNKTSSPLPAISFLFNFFYLILFNLTSYLPILAYLSELENKRKQNKTRHFLYPSLLKFSSTEVYKFLDNGFQVLPPGDSRSSRLLGSPFHLVVKLSSQ